MMSDNHLSNGIQLEVRMAARMQQLPRVSQVDFEGVLS